MLRAKAVSGMLSPLHLQSISDTPHTSHPPHTPHTSPTPSSRHLALY
ncbi:MAG: hypothetical protein F6J93_33130 [Oscillatoria sp. SIO1A7]|nr:hypothetical protein [Oscillatoria sp. SIO1A7]